ncbi:hypothetical protein D0Z00_000678 [Geotrichum galactomycetum]|uniref:Uncharacterized protein n=1 Tax=Geotrichum galactomycetum TaxID=27317 RepID=A0ACB6V937_9ASCO|nr:hypothetical protein D0Z00_000678 [Geotrichum candidum]
MLSPLRTSTRSVRPFANISACRVFYPVTARRSFLSLSSDLQKYKIKRIVKIDPQVLYDVVADVHRYHEFIPYCQQSQITEVDAATNRPKRAVLQVGWNQINESFESSLTYDERTVIAEAFNNDMFKTLYTKWVILPAPKNSAIAQVDFELKFCFNSTIYNAFSKNFGPSIASLMIKAFTTRAIELQKTV